MKTILRSRLILGILLVSPSFFSFSQVSINKDNSPPHSSAILEVKANDAGLLIPRMTVAQRIAIPTPAIGLMVYQTNGISGFYFYNGTAWERIGVNAGHYVGELYGGGVVIWVNNTNDHGLICSMVDLDTSMVWSNVPIVEMGDAARSDWDGLANSLAIVAQPQVTISAAKLCLDYTNLDYGTGIFSDWYLPAIAELAELANNIYAVQKALDTDGNPATTVVRTGDYWTSTQVGNNSAAHLTDLLPYYSFGFPLELKVRAVRKF